MTVHELIRALMDMPGESQVYYPYDGNLADAPIAHVWLSKEGYTVLACPWEPIDNKKYRPVNCDDDGRTWKYDWWIKEEK